MSSDGGVSGLMPFDVVIVVVVGGKVWNEREGRHSACDGINNVTVIVAVLWHPIA